MYHSNINTNASNSQQQQQMPTQRIPLENDLVMYNIDETAGNEINVPASSGDQDPGRQTRRKASYHRHSHEQIMEMER